MEIIMAIKKNGTQAAFVNEKMNWNFIDKFNYSLQCIVFSAVCCIFGGFVLFIRIFFLWIEFERHSNRNRNWYDLKINIHIHRSECVYTWIGVVCIHGTHTPSRRFCVDDTQTRTHRMYTTPNEESQTVHIDRMEMMVGTERRVKREQK